MKKIKKIKKYPVPVSTRISPLDAFKLRTMVRKYHLDKGIIIRKAIHFCITHPGEILYNAERV